MGTAWGGSCEAAVDWRLREAIAVSSCPKMAWKSSCSSRGLMRLAPCGGAAGSGRGVACCKLGERTGLSPLLEKISGVVCTYGVVVEVEVVLGEGWAGGGMVVPAD